MLNSSRSVGDDAFIVYFYHFKLNYGVVIKKINNNDKIE